MHVKHQREFSGVSRAKTVLAGGTRIARSVLFALLFATVITAAALHRAPPLQVARIFGDGVVLQNIRFVHVWNHSLVRSTLPEILQANF